MNVAAELLLVAGAGVAAWLAARAVIGRARPETPVVHRRPESPVEYYLRAQREKARAWGDGGDR